MSFETYINNAPWDEIRFHFEVIGLTTTQLAERYHVPTDIILDMAEKAEWVDHNQLTAGELNDKTNEYYKRARMNLTAEMSNRSTGLYQTINKLEDRLLVQCEKLLEHYEKPQCLPETMDLQRVGNMLAKLAGSYKIFEEAVIAPAQSDRKAILEDGNNTLQQMFDDIDGEGRELPNVPEDDDAQTKG